MSRELYEAEYETSITAHRMLKDLVKNDMAKGQALDQGCWKGFNSFSPQKQLSAVKALRRANLEALVNPSAYLQKLIDYLKYSKVKSGSPSLTTNSFTRPEAQSSFKKQGIQTNDNGAASVRTTSNLWADPQAAKVKLLGGKKAWTGKEVLASAVHSGLLNDCLDEDCLTFFKGLTEAQQLHAANEFRRRATPMIRNPSALLTSITARAHSAGSISSEARIAPPARTPSTSAKPRGRLNAQQTPHALFLDNLSPECRRAYERLPSKAQYRLKQRCAKDKAVRTRSEAFLRKIYSIKGLGSPQQAHTEGAPLTRPRDSNNTGPTCVREDPDPKHKSSTPAGHAGIDRTGEDELIPAYHPDGAIEAQYEPDAPCRHLPGWAADAPETPPMTNPPRPWMSDQAPSQQGGPCASAAEAPEAAEMPPATEGIDSAAQELMRLLVS